jgi:transposase-like protein
VKVAGHWRYVYRAVDHSGQVIDVFVSAQRDANAACRFFERAIATTKVTPVEVVTDRTATYPLVLASVFHEAWAAMLVSYARSPLSRENAAV